jgi:hypothetical protein
LLQDYRGFVSPASFLRFFFALAAAYCPGRSNRVLQLPLAAVSEYAVDSVLLAKSARMSWKRKAKRVGLVLSQRWQPGRGHPIPVNQAPIRYQSFWDQKPRMKPGSGWSDRNACSEQKMDGLSRDIRGVWDNAKWMGMGCKPVEVTDGPPKATRPLKVGPG